MAIVLGGFTFKDYAIPESVPQGGEHNFVVHKLIGGGRVINAMGPDDSDITWHGRFQGNGAVAQALAIEQLRKSGSQVPLFIDSQFYMVGVRKFEWDYQRSYQILYKISCVVATMSAPGGMGSQSVDGMVGGDMAASGDMTSGFVDNANVAGGPSADVGAVAGGP
jgi:hypothetical protein